MLLWKVVLVVQLAISTVASLEAAIPESADDQAATVHMDTESMHSSDPPETTGEKKTEATPDDAVVEDKQKEAVPEKVVAPKVDSPETIGEKKAEAPPDAAPRSLHVVNSVAQTVEAKLGVSSSVSQVVTWIAIFAVCWVALQIFQGAFGGASKKRRQRGQLLVLLGQCGSGKTALFYRLKDQIEIETVSSLKSAREKIRIKPDDSEEELGPIDVIDYPGHLRFRGKQAELLGEARCIVYMIDAEDKKRLKDVAEHLYELFTSKEVLEMRIPILLACNKTELGGARPDKFILEELEREIEQMRVSRGATLAGEDQADSYLGVDGEKFKILEHSPCPVEICRISAKKPSLGPLYDFLRQQYA
jgi:signal recognition particle receptor subunit beta